MDKVTEIAEALRGAGALVWINTHGSGSWFPELTVIPVSGTMRLIAVVDDREAPLAPALEAFQEHYYFYCLEDADDALDWLEWLSAGIRTNDRGDVYEGREATAGIERHDAPMAPMAPARPTVGV